MIKKIVILGAQGMLGSMLVNIFKDYNPTAWDKTELDLTDEVAVRTRLIELAPDVIINAAAYTDVDGAEDPASHELCWAINEGVVRTLATIAKETDATLVHYSTDYVFPGTKKSGYTEDDSPGPVVNAYGQSKLAGEQALKEISPTFYLLRTAWLYGPGGKNFVDTMLALGQERDRVQVVSDQHGSPTFTKDVANVTRELLSSDLYQPGIYHAVNFGQTTWHGLAQKIFELKGMAVEVEPVSSDQFPRPAQRPAYSALQNTKGPRLRHWQDALADYLSRTAD